MLCPHALVDVWQTNNDVGGACNQTALRQFVRGFTRAIPEDRLLLLDLIADRSVKKTVHLVTCPRTLHPTYTVFLFSSDTTQQLDIFKRRDGEPKISVQNAPYTTVSAHFISRLTQVFAHETPHHTPPMVHFLTLFTVAVAD